MSEFTLEETYEVCKDQPGFDGRIHVELVRLRMNAYLLHKMREELTWWHKNWHRDLGIPCDGTMEVCKRAMNPAGAAPQPLEGSE